MVVLALLIAGITACKSTANVPHLNVELPKSLKENKELKEFVLEAQKEANELAVGCVKMHAEALPFLEADFDALDEKQQVALVKLDYDYVEMWYNFNVKSTTRAFKIMQYMQDKSRLPQEIADLGKTMAVVNQFVQELKDTYGEDLRLDPYPVTDPESEVPELLEVE